MKPVRFYPLPFLILLLLVTTFSGYLLAAESESITITDPIEDSSAGQNEAEQESETEAEPVLENDDSFIPSVQISEDLSVSFPVNI